jgi:diguanylate cyclase (GGDEF)-like protein
MLNIDWKAKSFRFWLVFGLTLAVLPLAVSAVVGHLLLRRGVMAPFADVASRQRYQLGPAYRLRGALLEAVQPVDQFIDDGDPARPPAYRLLRGRIETAFAELHRQLERDPEPRLLVERARDEWTTADHLATEAIGVRRPAGDPRGTELMQRFHGSMTAAADRIGAVIADLDADLVHDHDEALLFDERSEWVAGLAAFLSLLTMIAGVVTVGRIVSGSVDRLVSGAEHFATGDWQHRIDVQVPPELHRVAEEFNRMIQRIHQTEEALADLARRDGLTKLPNRRAFDDGIREMLARMHRLGESGALLMMDIDHFKRINDTYGHGVGDDVLCSVARTLAADVRLVDRVFRIGGEEFAVILAGADATVALATAERLRQAVGGTRVAVRGHELTATVSVGVAMAEEGFDPAALMEAADAALYRAKKEGRNRVVAHSGSDDPVAEPRVTAS